MIAYNDENKNTPIVRLNPIVKIIIICFFTITLTFDYKPYLSVYLFTIGIISFKLFGNYSMKKILKTITPFITLAFGFTLFILITRGLNHNNYYDLHFLIFKWKTKDLVLAFALGARILVITFYSAYFVITTDPIEFTLSLIKYLKLPVQIGYALLTAYRFLPTFKDELQTIQFAHEIRGGQSKKGITRLFKQTKLCMIPMLANAVRKGERVALAMETRAFGKYKDRTYYRNIKMNKNDIITLLIFTIFFIISIGLFIKFNLVKFSFGFNL